MAPKDVAVDNLEPPSPIPNDVDEKAAFRKEGDDIESGSAPAANQIDESGPQDPNIVDWDGPDDPMNAMNWPLRKKLNITMTISFITLLTYVVLH
jgi:hypothetical protein